jgi:hypothetical protein
MTAPLPPTDGATPVGDRGGMQGAEQSADIQAALPDLAGTAAAAQSAGEAWNAGAAQWADSPQGAGSGGFTLGGDTPGEWDSDVSFPHQGP